MLAPPFRNPTARAFTFGRRVGWRLRKGDGWMTGGFGEWKGFSPFALLALLACGGLSAQNEAFAQSAECARLQQAIASAPRGNGQAQAAAERQRAELARTSAYARSIGCDNQKFLFFGSDPPPQCGEIKGQIARMQASLADLQARAGGGRAELVARYNAECVNAPRQPANLLEALFGGFARPPGPSVETLPPDEQQQTIEKSIEEEKNSGVNARAGSYAVCVKTCDGSFFPVSYSGAGSRADSLEDVCRSLCPNADVQLYSFPFGGTISQAVSANGEPYVNLPNALKFEQTFDGSCSCRRKGESWAQALAAAEAKYGHESHDILVTPEKSAELSRPIVSKAAADPKAKPQKSNAKAVVAPPDAPAPPATQPPGLDASGVDTALGAAAASVSRETSGIAGGDAQSSARYGEGQGETVTEVAPDGVKRSVRIVGPTL